MVGAIVVDDEGVVVGRGSHEVAGGPHAEVYALSAAGARARGGTLYCTLEPCSHTGRTGPCAPLVVASGVRRAVIAVEDPNPLVAGRGLSLLREHGIEVRLGVLGERAARLNDPFFTVMRRRRPFVTMKVALSRDRRVAAGPGRRTALTGPAANRLIHRERAEVDAIAVGSGTVRTDDPLLTARGAYRTRPLARVIFDRSLRTAPSARMFSTRDAGPIILVAAGQADSGRRQKAEALTAAGGRVEWVDGESPDVFLPVALERLAASGISSLVVEGGPTLHRAFWAAGLVDKVQLFMTPAALGAAGVPWLEPSLVAPEHLVGVRSLALGDDRMIEGYVHGTD